MFNLKFFGMISRIKLIVITTAMICAIDSMGQIQLPDPMLETDFAAQVKSVDEFIARFNGKEFSPEIAADSSRRDNVLSLFDFKMSREGLDDKAFEKLVNDFANEVVDWDSCLSISSKGTVAEAICLFKYDGKEKEITLLLQREVTSKGNQRWALTGVKGMDCLGLFGKKRVTISPVDHETHFMSLQDFFQSNPYLVPSMRSEHLEVDQMSFLFGLSIARKIKFLLVKKLRFHFFDVPNYMFCIEEIGRRGVNSGWLITHLERATNSNKKKCINDLFGRNIQ